EHFATAAPGPRGRARTGLNAARLRELPWLLLDGETRSLGELLSPDAGTPPFEAGPGPAAQGWSLVHFLLASEEPRRRLLVPGLLAELRRGARLGPAAAAVFEDVDLEQLQADWQAWAASQPCDDPLADLARRYGDKVRPDQLTGDQDLERRYAWLWRRRDGPQPGDPP
ncbi:MAG TPA: hypothetical protein VFD43_01975, partial [Planctomycetota bacterium]|nr:hypothetical protein [Planctomycetota bacterium]